MRHGTSHSESSADEPLSLLDLDLPLGIVSEIVDAITPRWNSPIPADVQRTAALLVADYVGISFAGAHTDTQTRLRETLVARDHGGPSSLIASSARVSPTTAAFINASAATEFDFDDYLPEAIFGSHPYLHILPAAIAEADDLGKSYPDLLRALCLGYEAAALFGSIFPGRPGWLHPHGHWNFILPAVAVAALADLPAESLIDVINSAAAMASVPPIHACQEGATLRNSYAGFGNVNGLFAVRGVEAGLTAPSGGLEHLLDRMRADDFEPLEVITDSWAVARTRMKIYPVCAAFHPALHRVRAVIQSEGIGADQITAIEVSGLRRLATFMTRRPHNRLAARFSLPFSLAEEVVHGLGAGAPAPVDDERVIALAAKVTLTNLDADDAVVVRTTDGRRLTAPDVPHTPGLAELGAAAVREKFLRNVSDAGGESFAAQWWDHLTDVTRHTSHQLPDLSGSGGIKDNRSI